MKDNTIVSDGEGAGYYWGLSIPRTFVPNCMSCFCSVSIECGQAIIALMRDAGQRIAARVEVR